jgi:hypothetical protein
VHVHVFHKFFKQKDLFLGTTWNRKSNSGMKHVGITTHQMPT